MDKSEIKFIKSMKPLDAYNYGKQKAERELINLGEYEHNEGSIEAIDKCKGIVHQFFIDFLNMIPDDSKNDIDKYVLFPDIEILKRLNKLKVNQSEPK